MRKLAILLLCSIVFCLYSGKIHAQTLTNNITTVFSCKSVSVLTKKYEISNVVLLFTDSTKQKFDNLKGNAGTYAGTGQYAGKIIAGVWVKAGNNFSGDCPGCGEFFKSTQTNCTGNTGGGDGQATVIVNCTATMVTSTVTIETITFLFDNYTTQTLQINSKTANVKPTDRFEGFFVRGVYVQLQGGTNVSTVKGQTVKGKYYANTCYNINAGTASTGADNAGSADCMAGNAHAENIIYKVNGKIVPTLAGNVQEGNYVEVTFTTAAGTEPTRYSLVAYNTMDASYSEHTAIDNDVFDYESDMFTGGTHTIGVTVPNNYFQVDFVKGCVIWKFGPEGANNYYEKQGRLMGRANGGSRTPCSNCEENKKVTICHVPKGNPANAHTITISQNAAKAHIGRHGGDYYGECQNTPPTTGGEVSAEFTCTSVKITSKNQMLAYVVLLFSDSTRQKFENIASLGGVFSGTGANTGKTVIGVWVKASNNVAGDCSGCGTFFKSNADCGGGNGTADVSVTCSTATVSSNVKIQTITLLLDDSSTQTFVIDAKTASISPNNEYEGYFVRGAFVQLEGGTTTTNINGTEVQGNFYANEGFDECEGLIEPGLPVQLTKFEAKKLEPSVVKLEWSTASETNNDYIAIEKSSDIENWKEVCRVPSAAPGGNSQHVHDYSCTDDHANEDGQNIVYYRPKQVDLNGTYEYHNTIRVRLQDAAYATEIQSVYPNPATDRLNIRYNAAENSIFRLKLISLDGKALLQNQYVAKPGVQTLDLDLMEDKLKPGLYVLEIQTEGEVFRQKVYKQ